MDERLLVKVFAFMAIAVTCGWLIVLLIVPIFRPDYRPPPEVTALMGTFFTALAGLLGTAYYKAKHPHDGDEKEERNEDGGNAE